MALGMKTVFLGDRDTATGKSGQKDPHPEPGGTAKPAYPLSPRAGHSK